MPLFDGFSAADFQAFTQQKWSSHAFNRERLEVKLKLAVLGRALLAGLEKRLGSLETDLSDERPSVFNDHRVAWLSWWAWRGGPERRLVEARQTGGAGLDGGGLATRAAGEHFHFEIKIAAAELRAGLVLPVRATVDWHNLLAAGDDTQQAAAIAELLGGLADELALDDGTGRRLDSLAPRRWLQQLENGGRAELWLACSYSSDQVAALGAGLVEHLHRQFDLLVPVYLLLAWHRENDRLGLVQKLKLERQQAASQLEVGMEVRILGGLAAGRQGVIEEMLRHGQVAVRLGNLVLTMKADELEPLAGRREKRR